MHLQDRKRAAHDKQRALDQAHELWKQEVQQLQAKHKKDIDSLIESWSVSVICFVAKTLPELSTSALCFTPNCCTSCSHNLASSHQAHKADYKVHIDFSARQLGICNLLHELQYANAVTLSAVIPVPWAQPVS